MLLLQNVAMGFFGGIFVEDRVPFGGKKVYVRFICHPALHPHSNFEQKKRTNSGKAGAAAVENSSILNMLIKVS